MANAATTLRKQFSEGIGHLIAAAVIIAGAFSVNGLFGLSVVQTAGLGLLFVAFTYIVVSSESELSFPFMASLAAVLLAVWQFVLDPVIGDVIPVESWFRMLGIDITQLDAVNLLFIVTVAILAYWTVTIRAGSGAKNADSVAKRLQSNVEGLFETYATIGRLTVAAVLTMGFILFSEAGALAGDFVSIVGEAPLVASNLLTAGVGYLSLGGSLPYLSSVPLLGSLTAGEFAVVALVVVVLAVGVKSS